MFNNELCGDGLFSFPLDGIQKTAARIVDAMDHPFLSEEEKREEIAYQIREGLVDFTSRMKLESGNVT